MTLEQLRIFIAVAEREHVTRAAGDLNLTQSATSAAVAALEARYASKLFDRVGRRISLTDAGRLFLNEAKAVLARANAAELVLADLAGLKLGSLALAASQTVGNYWLPRFIHAFRSAHPGIAVALTIGNTETVASQVRDGEANLGFVEGTIEEPALTTTIVAEDEMVLVAHPAHDWCRRRKTKEINLRSARWVLRELGSGTRAILEPLLKRESITLSDLDVSLVMPTNEAVRAAVEAGAGVTIISRLVADKALKTGTLVAVDYPIPRRQFTMLRHKDRYTTAAETEFARLIGELAAT